MKEVMAAIRMNKINDTKRALNEAGISSFTATGRVQGRGKGLVDYRILHGARGNETDQRRRAFSLRLLGDDARYVQRPGPTSPPFPGHDMVPGQKLREDWFPVLFQR